jgi:ectoine hydroxylase-related dioxygenase (phytanoyl-CoA dioxygenase family)
MPRNDASDLRAAYDRDGYVIAREAIDRELAQEACDHVNWLLAKHPKLRPEDLHHNLMIGDPFWHRLISDSRLVDLAEVFIGPNVALFATHYIAKAPKTGRPVLWHQDGSYWPLEPMEVTTLWLACSDSTPENGCMRVIPGTQTLDLQEMKPNEAVDSVLHSEIDASFVDDTNAVDFVLAPGDVSIHNPKIVHGSNANTSDRWRVGLTIRYIPTSTAITRDGAGSPYLLRGEAVAGVNQYLDRPVFREGEHFAFRDRALYAG